MGKQEFIKQYMALHPRKPTMDLSDYAEHLERRWQQYQYENELSWEQIKQDLEKTLGREIHLITGVGRIAVLKTTPIVNI